ncbi:DUF349 domain-containing protein [Serinicoccus kebangsaanensis]|uniref:DUF349 domain-containing protein n=1 Tax=Serinicoccus kebangsaanensis TaxID=2602069 RepID=UPI00124EC263|nr:DUF349 domain-containing protein [Serinicoccus kebangsaanensis]
MVALAVPAGEATTVSEQTPSPSQPEEPAAEPQVAATQDAEPTPVGGTTEPAEEAADAPAEEVAETPAEEVAEAPTDVPSEPAEETAEAPVEPATDAVDAPAEEADQAPETPADLPSEPAEETAAAPVEPATDETAAEVTAEPPAEPTAEAPAADAPAEAAPAPTPAAPKPTPRPAAPSPSMFATRKPAAPRPAPAGAGATPEPHPDPSESMKHGRVGEDGTVYVIAADGSEREVGSYPGASPEEALAYFARKYDEMLASADLLKARLAGTEVSAHDARQSLAHLKEQIGEAHVVGDLAALTTVVTHLEEEVRTRSRTEQEQRVRAKAEAAQEREKLVVEAEKLAATEPSKVQWKQSSTRVRELLEEWKAHQRSGPRLDKELENSLWQRFSHARSGFDKMRKSWFAQLDEEHATAKSVKERLVREAEALSTSKDWGATAGSFKRLMQEWKRAGRASRADDDALWARFKAAQDSFFDAKDEVVAAEEAEFAENLKVKQGLLVEAEAITVDEGHLDQAKAELRKIQDRWDAAGKVPRADIKRVENRLRSVEQKVRDIEDSQWKRTDPELNARAQSMVDQLERAVQGLEADLSAAQAAGDEKKAQDLEAELSTKKTWLQSARGGLGR